MGIFANRRANGRRKVSLGDVRKGAKVAGQVADIAGSIVAFVPGVGPAVNLALRGAAMGAKAAEKAAEKAEQAAELGKTKQAKHRRRRARGHARKAAVRLEVAEVATQVEQETGVVAPAGPSPLVIGLGLVGALGLAYVVSRKGR